MVTWPSLRPTPRRTVDLVNAVAPAYDGSQTTNDIPGQLWSECRLTIGPRGASYQRTAFVVQFTSK